MGHAPEDDASALPAWLIEARERYVPHVYPEPGPVRPGDIRLLDPYDDTTLRQHVMVTKIESDSPWTAERPVATVLLVSGDVDLAYDDDYRVLGDTPYDMIVIAQAIGAVWADRLGDLIHRCPKMLDPLREITSGPPRGFAGPLPPAGLPIRSSADSRVAARMQGLHEPFQRCLDNWEIMDAAEAYLQTDPDYDGPGVSRL